LRRLDRGSENDKNITRMKVFIWLITLAFTVVCLCAWAVSEVILRYHGEIPLPGLTVWLLNPNWWLLVCPTPWIIYSVVLSLRRPATLEHVLIFCGTQVLAAALLVSLVTLACVLPWLPLKMSLCQ
jgi:hypothetical protein